MTRATVLVTGASSGFGRAICARLAHDGWHVLATMRGPPGPGSELALSPGALGRITTLKLDVTSAADREAASSFVREQCHGRLEALINNAGYGLFGALEDLTEAELRLQLEVNFFGAALLTRALLPFLRQARGRIVNVSSLFGASGMPLTGAYCASKFALEGLSEALRHELRPHGVEVTIVQPGGHKTRFGQNAQWGSGSEAAYAVQRRSYLALRSRLVARQGVPPNGVAEAVASLLRRRKMPVRVRLGSDARSLYWLLRLFPERLAFGILGRVYDRMFLALAKETT